MQKLKADIKCNLCGKHGNEFLLRKKYFCDKDWCSNAKQTRASHLNTPRSGAPQEQSDEEDGAIQSAIVCGSAKTIYAASFKRNDTIFDCVKR